jgi:U11/U12 small nuclear ribonucleoprotein SNRNP65
LLLLGILIFQFFHRIWSFIIVTQYFFFIRFESQEFAEAVIQRLHQKELLGHRLTVELSQNDLDVNLMKNSKPLPEIECNANEVKKLQEAYLKKLNSWSTAIDLNQPPPHHLRYSYPDPNPHILSNIANMLACNQKFYYQVLHLMNRMNLPAPFEPVEGCSLKNYMKTETADKYTTTVETDPELSESEMESEGESEHVDRVESKHSSTRKKISKGMIPKRLKVVSGTIQKKPKVELSNVFDTVECEVPKKIEVKVSAELNPAEGPIVNTEGGFGVIYSTKSVISEEIKKGNESEDDDVTGDSISREELATNRLSENDMKDMPIFKNYYPGAPSCRLYIKNLAKTVTDTDLKYIYKRFIKSGDIKPGTMLVKSNNFLFDLLFKFFFILYLLFIGLIYD